MQMECGVCAMGRPYRWASLAARPRRCARSVFVARLVDILLAAVTRNKRDNEAGQKNVELASHSWPLDVTKHAGREWLHRPDGETQAASDWPRIPDVTFRKQRLGARGGEWFKSHIPGVPV